MSKPKERTGLLLPEGYIFRYARYISGLALSDAAMKVGLSRTQVGMIELNNRLLKIEDLACFAGAYGLSTEIVACSFGYNEQDLAEQGIEIVSATKLERFLLRQLVGCQDLDSPGTISFIVNSVIEYAQSSTGGGF